MKKTKLTRSLMAAVSIVALSAVMYGCVHSGDDPVEVVAPDLGPAMSAAQAAADAAKAASGAAAAAVAGVEDSRNADAASYVFAQGAADDAMAAYMAAKAANAAAQAAETLEDAEAAQADAEAAQADAEAAQGNAEMYAQMVADAQAALDQAEADRIAAEEEAARLAAEAEAARIAAEEEAARQAAAAAEAEAMALAAARTAADMAADAAEMSASDAADEVMDVMDIAGSDQTSYDAAVAARDAAMAAATAAREASDAANRATTSADAEMYQMTAETQQGMAADSLSDAMMYAGMVTQAKADADAAAAAAAAAAEAAQMLADTKQAAQDAEDAAATAKDAAAMSVTDVEDSGVLDTDVTAAAAFARAEDASDDAAAAHLDAVDANLKAQAAMTQEDATMYKNMAEAAQMAAENAQRAAARFAMIVSETQTAADNKAQEDADQAEQDRLAAEAEEQRKMDVADAKAAAMQSYMDADADAMKAEAQADAAEATAPGTAGAMAARAAATAARTAATAAKTAHDAIMDTMTKAEADMQAAEAATQAGNANTGYMTAKAQNDAVQTATLIAEQLQEARDLSDAQDDAKMYADEAKGHYESAMSKATDARAEATKARAAANRAMAARTDYANADKYATMAEANADAAEAARNAAKAASDAANAAYMAAMAAEAVMDDPATEDVDESMKPSQVARAEADKAKAQNVIATANHTGDDGAGMQYMAAKDNAMKAETAAGVHVVGLLEVANAQSETDADDRAEAITAWAGRIGAAAGSSTDADNDSRASPTLAAVTAAWPANTPANPDATPPTEEVPMHLSVTVTNVDDAAVESDTMGDADADPVVMPNAKAIDGVPGFMYGFDIEFDTGRILVFTDKDQDDAPVEASDAVTARTVENVAVSTTTLTKLGTKVGNTYTGAEYTPTGEPALTGTLTCPDGTTCSVDATTAADGTVTINAVSGYVFTGSREAKAAVVAMDAAAQAAANRYLAFGVWLNEDGNNDGTVDDPAFGAFAGTDSATAPVDVAVIGTARYEGSAVGVYTAGSSVDYFQADATLNANFGVAPETGDDTAQGTVTGMIDNIMVGGTAMSDVINLFGAENNIGATGSFSGNARMGAPMVDGDVATYMYNGRWSGQFYGPTADDTTTNDVDESEVAPLSAAGTFGVTGTDNMGTMDDMEDDVTRSYVGAFGAHKPMDD